VQYYNKLLIDVSGGVNQAISRLLTADNECAKIENGELEKLGSVTKVRGYTQRGSDVSTGYNILGATGAYKSDGTQRQIVIADGASSSEGYIYTPATDSWTAQSLSLTSGAKAEFESYLDGIFMVNFDDATRFYNFSSWSTSTNVTDAPKAKYIKLYQSRLYLFYVVYGGNTYTSRCIYSDLPTDGSPMTLSWTNADNWFDVDSDDGDVGKGLEVNSNRLLLFKEKSLYRYDTNTLYKVPGCPGTVNNRSIKNLQGVTLYFHNTGIWSYDGAVSQLESRTIPELIEGISTSNFNNICAYVKGDHYYLYVGDVLNKRTGFSVENCLIDYDISKKAYTWRSLTKIPTIFTEYRDDRSNITYDDATITYNDADTAYNAVMSTEQRIYFGTTIGEILHQDNGNNYDGSPIKFLFETRDIYLDSPNYWKLLQKLIVMVKNGQGIIIQYKCDDGDWKTLGKVNKTQTVLNFPSGTKCQRIKFRATEMSTGSQFIFEGYDVYYTLGSLIE